MAHLQVAIGSALLLPTLMPECDRGLAPNLISRGRGSIARPQGQGKEKGRGLLLLNKHTMLNRRQHVQAAWQISSNTVQSIAACLQCSVLHKG